MEQRSQDGFAQLSGAINGTKGNSEEHGLGRGTFLKGHTWGKNILPGADENDIGSKVTIIKGN
jgi:hypothetical protein